MARYNTNDLVFAKVRGYPAWPARIHAMASDANNAKQVKYHVFFFGTYETAVCKGEDLFLYATNKDKFSKKQTRRGYKEALWEIVNDPTITAKRAREQATVHVPDDYEPSAGETDVAGDVDSDAEGSLVIDEGAAAAAKAKSTPVPPARKTALKRKKDGTATPEPSETEAKKRKVSATGRRSSILAESSKMAAPTPPAPTPSTSPPEPERVSRSGRKIKPKRFLDEEEFETPGASGETEEVVAKPAARRQSTQRSDTSKETQATPKAAKEKESKDPVQGGIEEDFLQTAPAPVSPVKSLQGDKNVEVRVNKQQALKLIENKNVQAREKVNQQVTPQARQVQKKRQEAKDNKTMEKKRLKLMWLKMEVRLNQIDAEIKSKLRTSYADTDGVLVLLDELKNLKVAPLMLKKQPNILITIRKLRKYVGCLNTWDCTQNEKDKFLVQSKEIRDKATMIYNAFKNLFLTSADQSFLPVFMQQVEELKSATSDLPPAKFVTLVQDPSVDIGEEKKTEEPKEASKEAQVDNEGTSNAPEQAEETAIEDKKRNEEEEEEADKEEDEMEVDDEGGDDNVSDTPDDNK